MSKSGKETNTGTSRVEITVTINTIRRTLWVDPDENMLICASPRFLLQR